LNTRFYQSGWPDSANEVVLWRCSSLDISSCNSLKRNSSLGFVLEKDKQYCFNFVFKDNVLDFYIDGINVLSFSDLSSDDLIGKIGF